MRKLIDAFVTAIESLAENASDGIIAPVFWGALFGLPGIIGYKAINTLDSMIGHRTERHESFGWAAARIDDLANFIPARLTGFLFALLAAFVVCAAAGLVHILVLAGEGATVHIYLPVLFASAAART